MDKEDETTTSVVPYYVFDEDAIHANIIFSLQHELLQNKIPNNIVIEHTSNLALDLNQGLC